MDIVILHCTTDTWVDNPNTRMRWWHKNEASCLEPDPTLQDGDIG